MAEANFLTGLLYQMAGNWQAMQIREANEKGGFTFSPGNVLPVPSVPLASRGGNDTIREAIRFADPAIMIVRIVFALVVTALAAAQTSPPATSPTKFEIDPVARAWAKALGNYGVWWNTLSEDGKDNFIGGYTDAMDHANLVLGTFCEDSTKTLKPGPAFDAQMKGLMTLCMLTNEFNFKVTSPFKPRLDEFYKDPLNARIPPFLAMQYARDEMNGKKTAGQLLDELNDWRKTVNKPAK